MNIETIEAIKAVIGKLNYIKGFTVITVDDSCAVGKSFFSAEIKVCSGKEGFLDSFERLSKLIGHLNGEGLFTEVDIQKRTLTLK